MSTGGGGGRGRSSCHAAKVEEKRKNKRPIKRASWPNRSSVVLLTGVTRRWLYGEFWEKRDELSRVDDDKTEEDRALFEVDTCSGCCCSCGGGGGGSERGDAKVKEVEIEAKTKKTEEQPYCTARAATTDWSTDSNSSLGSISRSSW